MLIKVETVSIVIGKFRSNLDELECLAHENWRRNIHATPPTDG